MAFRTEAVERLRITSGGALCLGTTAVDNNAKFQLADNSYPDLGLKYKGTSGGHKTRLMFIDKRGVINAQVANVLHNDGVGSAAADLEFASSTGGTLTRRMVITYSGTIQQHNSSTSNTSSQLHFVNTTSGGAYRVRFDSNSSTVGSIQVNTSSTAYNTSSDYRLKENITAISDGITRLKTLKPSRFNWKSDSSTTVDGFIAHEVTAVPEAISGTKDAVATEDTEESKKGDPIYQQIDQSKLVPLLTAALQEAITEIETLKSRLDAAGL